MCCCAVVDYTTVDYKLQCFQRLLYFGLPPVRNVYIHFHRCQFVKQHFTISTIFIAFHFTLFVLSAHSRSFARWFLFFNISILPNNQYFYGHPEWPRFANTWKNDTPIFQLMAKKMHFIRRERMCEIGTTRGHGHSRDGDG